MPKILLLLLLSLTAFANPWTYRVDTGSSNLGADFLSPVLTGVSPNTSAPLVYGPSVGFKSIQVYNATSGEIEVNCSRGDGYHPLASTDYLDSFYVPASTGWSTPETQPSLGRACYVRSKSGTLSSGVIQIVGWGQ